MKKVLVFRTGSLGDSIVALPSIKRIRACNPNCTITLLTNFPIDGGIKAISAYQIYNCGELVDNYIEYKISKNIFDIKELFMIVKNIGSIDKLYYLMPRRSYPQKIRDFIFFKLCGVKKIIGINFNSSDPHYKIDKNLNDLESKRLLRQIKFSQNLELNDFSLYLHPQEIIKFKKLFNPLSKKKIILISLGSKFDENKWAVYNWKFLIVLLANTFSNHIIISIGSQDELHECEDVISVWPFDKLNLTGKTDIAELYFLMQYAVLFIGNDSGPMHLAAAAGTKVIGLFSNKNGAGKWYPFNNEKNVIQAEEGKSINSISPKSVNEAAIRLLVN